MTEHALTVSGVTIGGRHRPMLPPTDLELRTGEVRAVVGEPGHGHTALALILAGRLRPDAGRALLDGSPTDTSRQRAVALVDVPGVTEPDDLVPMRTILGEELAMAGMPARRRAVRNWAVRAWPVGAGTPDVDISRRTEDVPPERRTTLLLRAAARRPDVRFLVLTLPDRWGVTPAQWQPVAAQLARHGLGILVTVGVTSRHLLGVPHTTIGPEEPA
jgi:energy-coupling factor transporter ATP-binding protein EcfA2